MGFSGLMAFWQESGLDPILLGQPTIWVTSSDATYLRNASNVTPSNGDLLNSFRRYTDNGFTGTTDNLSKASYNVVSNQPHPYGYVGWTGITGVTNGLYSGGTTSSLPFMHRSGSTNTVYFVFKNNPVENTTTTKYIAGTTVSTGGRGFILSLQNATTTTRRIGYSTNNDVGSTVSTSVNSNYIYTASADTPIALYSIRNDLRVATGQTASWLYRNGILDDTSLLVNPTSNTLVSNSIFCMGNRTIGGLRFNGYIGELIIFNTIHSEATHLKVCNYLKDKWRIS